MATAKENYLDRKIVREFTMTQHSICIYLYIYCFANYKITRGKTKPELKFRQSETEVWMESQAFATGNPGFKPSLLHNN